MDFGHARKRGRPDAGLNGNAGFKKNKQETESFSGIGSKSKPCTKFFSTAGCPFGEGCHFLHHVPGGLTTVTHILNMGGGNPAHLPRNPMGGGPPEGPSPPSAKTKMCKNFTSPEGCKFGDKCHFAHGERELSTPYPSLREDPRTVGRFGPGRPEPEQRSSAAASFGASATAKISVDASLAGAIIGKGGVNSKEICRITGAKLSIRDHESDTNLRNIELEGTFDQIKQASSMVHELIVNVSLSAPARHVKTPATGPPSVKTPASNFKTKLCENFAKGACTFGERCHFAHGEAELRKQGP